MNLVEVQENLSPGQAGSPANQQRAVEAAIRTAELFIEAMNGCSERLERSVGQLTDEIGSAKQESERAGKKMIALNRTLVWLTWVLVVLTIVMVVFGLPTFVEWLKE